MSDAKKESGARSQNPEEEKIGIRSSLQGQHIVLSILKNERVR